MTLEMCTKVCKTMETRLVFVDRVKSAYSEHLMNWEKVMSMSYYNYFWLLK